MKIIEIQGDLFSTDIKCKAQCVSVDCGMGKGIAVLFNKYYKAKDKMIDIAKNKQIKVGTAVPIESEGETIYQLITKKYYWYKPALNNLKKSLVSLKNDMLLRNIKEIAMPKIGSGLDELNWELVKQTIIDVFNDTDILIKVYYLDY